MVLSSRNTQVRKSQDCLGDPTERQLNSHCEINFIRSSNLACKQFYFSVLDQFGDSVIPGNIDP